MTRYGSRHAYQVRVSEAAEDPEWDTFLETTPGGHHVQTSLWGQIKANLGWRAVRIVATDGPDIVAGAQVLTRLLPLRHAIGYVPIGPVFARKDPALTELMVDALRRLAKRHRILHLTVQPPSGGEDFARSLPDSGFVLSDTEVAPTATVQLDLEADPETILARMKRNHRRYIRHGLRQGVIGRQGTGDDLATFYKLLSATAERQGFTPYSLSYYMTMWDVLHPKGHMELFVTEFEGEPVSAQIAIGFGETVITKNSGWSGRHPSLGSNHVLEWTTMNWAKSQGYRVYDLEGIDSKAGRMLAAGQRLPPEMRQRAFFWKLGFGGQVVLFPRAYAYVPNPVLRKLYSSLYPRAANWPVTARLIRSFRTG